MCVCGGGGVLMILSYNLHVLEQVRSHGVARGGKYHPCVTGRRFFATPRKMFLQSSWQPFFIAKEKYHRILI